MSSATNSLSDLALPDEPATNLKTTLSNALIISRREVRDSLRDWRIMVPIFLLTLVFPLLANLMTRVFASFFEENGAEDLLPALLPLMPMIVGFFPVSISLVIALETFVGEKERRSLEPLLSTPLTNTELYMGKSFAAMLPPLLASYTGIALYMGTLILGKEQWRPELSLVAQILALTTVQALVMVTGAVVISSQTTSTRAANLLASFIIIPTSLLVILEATIMVQPYKRYVLWYIVLAVLLTIVLLVRMGSRIFNREDLLGRSLDQLNLKWIWNIFWDEFRGPVHGIHPVQWYQQSVFPALGHLRIGLVIVLIAIVSAFIGGWVATDTYKIPLDGFDANDESLLDNLSSWLDLGEDHTGLVAAIFMQNARVLITATVMAIFTFGVLAVVVVMLPFGIIGFIMGQVVQAGLSPLPFIMAVLPHGIIEIPAIVIAGAAAIRVGSIITRPPDDVNASEAWIRAFSDTVKIGIGIITPMLIVAALLEVLLTPQVVAWVLAH